MTSIISGLDYFSISLYFSPTLPYPAPHPLSPSLPSLTWITSGAIQKGVPTTVFRFECVELRECVRAR